MSQATEAPVLNELDQMVSRFEYQCGVIDTPERVAQFNEFVTRCKGRTTVMVRAIVKALENHDRVGVLVHSLNHGKEIEKLVKEQLPFLKNDRLVLLSNATEQWRDKLRGFSKYPIFVDNAVTDLMVHNFVNKNVNGITWP